MPELPEVETIRRQLALRLPGRVLRGVTVWDPLLVSPEAPDAFVGALVGRRILGVERRGKYLVVPLDSGDALAMHLRMTGQLTWRAGPAPDGPHRRAAFALDDGATLLFRDVRRFGRAWLVPRDLPDAEGYWARRAGVEPLGARFTARRLATLLGGRRAPVKAAILNQALVAGVGNMYADEALWAARIHPLRPAGDLDAPEVRRLHRAIRDRLQVGIGAGGASIDTYRDALGERGGMQDLLRVYGRLGRPCPRCRTLILRTRVAQRGTYWCPRCQCAPC